MSEQVPLRRVTILVDRLSYTAATSTAMVFGRWLVRTGAARQVDIMAIHDGGRAQELEGIGACHVIYRRWGEPEPAPRAVLPGRGRVDQPLPAPFAGAHRSERQVRALGARLGRRLERVLQLARRQRLASIVRQATIRWWLRGDERDPVYLADPAAVRLLSAVPPRRRVVAHLHDDDAIARLAPADRALLAARPDAFALSAPAMAINRSDLVGDRGWRFVATMAAPTDEVAPSLDLRRALVVEHGIPLDAPLVCSFGEIDWWDQPDLFVPLAWELHRRPEGSRIHLAWLAARSTERMLWPLRHDVAHAGLGGFVHVVGDSHPLLDLIRAADVLVLTRRGRAEVPAWAELALAGTPIVHWRADQWTCEPGELVVPPVDEVAMADAVLRALTDPTVKEGAARRLTVSDRQPGVAHHGPALLELLRGD